MQGQSVEAKELSYKIIALHKGLIDAGYRISRLDVKLLQRSSKKILSGMYSQLLDLARGL